MIWRLVLGEIATLEELDNHWSYEDAVKANIALNFQERLEEPPPGKAGM